MRPIKLTMQAFGPYAGTQTLNMAELGETGIYAITGETGAGKTTIFDAIVYALYGSGSGEDRKDGKSLRAVGASPDVETKIELVFVSGGKEYRIERRPEQWLAGKRKAEPVKKPAAQVLIMPDETRYTRDGEIKEKIEKDILGVTKDQFCQIVMIAQGEFRELLRADTSQRIEIFRKIFKTDKYNRLTLEFKRLSDEKGEALTDARKAIAAALKTMEVEVDSPLREEWTRLSRTSPDALDIDSAAALAEGLVAQDEAAHAEAAEVLKSAEKAREQSRAAWEEAKGRAEDQRKLNDYRADLERQQKQLTDAVTAREDAESKKPEIEQLGKEITTEENLLPKYDELDIKAEAQKGLQKELADAVNARDQAKQKADDLRKKQAALTDEAERLKDAHERLRDFSDKLHEAEARGEKLRALDDRVRARDKAAAALKTADSAAKNAARDEQSAIEALNKCQAELEDLGNTALALSKLHEAERTLADEAKELEGVNVLYENFVKAGKACDAARKVFEQKQTLAERKRGEAVQLRQRYNANIAGILALDLVEGQPCPVCGSIHHPNPSALSAEATTAEAVDAAENAAKQAEDDFNAQARVCERNNADREGLKTQLAERLPDVLEADWLSDIQRRQSENVAARRENAGQLKAAKDADERRNQLEKTDLPKAQKAKEKATEQRQKADKALTSAETAHRNAETEVASAATIMPADWTPLDLSDALSENDGLRKTLKDGKKQAEKDIGRVEEIKTLQERNQKSIEAQSQTVLEQEKKIYELDAKIESGQQSIDDLKAVLPPCSKADFERAIGQKARRKKDLEDDIEAKKDAEKKISEDIARTEGMIEPLAEKLKDAPPADTDGAKAISDKAQADFEEKAKRERAIDKRREMNVKQRNTLLNQAEDAGRLEREYNMMKDIYDTASGKIGHVKLETFVQLSYFDRIIDYANQRLYHMSRQQYEFKRRDAADSGKQGQIGLDLDVFDYLNGQRRAVGTLSGGEGFLASLALALGMSDAIQASKSSAVKLDAMFVDEGFGSLSESFLRLVMDELNDTATAGHRLIGVISHVDEVKEEIKRRIEVSKSSFGVSKAEIR